MCMGITNAFEIGDEIGDNRQNTRVYDDHIAIDISGEPNPASYYSVKIYAVSIKPRKNPQSLMEIVQPNLPSIDKLLWTITADQLPLTKDSCIHLGLDTCDEKSTPCYDPCFSSLSPGIIAFDDKNKKLYLNYPATDIGTGGGSSLLFVADINKRDVHFLKTIAWPQNGSISPSGRYLVTHGISYISVYDTTTKSWFNMNKSENYYPLDGKKIIHDLDLKKWLTDTQFIYVDSTKYYLSNAEPMTFMSAKEVIYDIATKSKLSEKKITREEYEKFAKTMTPS